MSHVHKIAAPILVLVVLFIGSFSISHYIDRTGRILIVEELDRGNGAYQKKSEIDDLDIISRMNKIMSAARWDETREQDDNNADYRFYYQYKKERYEMKPVTYYVTVGKNGQQVKVTKDAGWSTILQNQSAADFMECIELSQ